MPDRRRHRGAHPEDRELFAEVALERLRAAVHDQCWLLTRGYAPESALALVGNRYQLALRQRSAVSRVACSEQRRVERSRRCVSVQELAGAGLCIDAFNVLISLEVALGGGLLLIGSEGAVRDLASVHGSYRRVLETPQAVERAIEELSLARAAEVTWYLDRPVSNSGNLARLLRERFSERGLDWRVELVESADREIVAAAGVALSADGGVLDRAPRWFDLAGRVIRERIPSAWVVDLASER